VLERKRGGEQKTIGPIFTRSSGSGIVERKALMPLPHAPSPSPSSSESKDAALDDETFVLAAPFASAPFDKYRFVKAPIIRSPPRSHWMSKLKKGGNTSLPPEFQAVLTKRHRFYFLVEVSGVTSVSVNDRYIRGACGGICTVANSKLMPWAGSIRVHSLTMWLPVVASSTASCDVYWVSTGTEFVKDDEKFRLIPEGVTVTGPMYFTPPAKSLAGDWISDAGAATNLFGLVAPNGTVVCLDVEFTLANNMVAIAQTIVSGTLAVPYYLALDGPTSNTLVPQGVPTTH